MTDTSRDWFLFIDRIQMIEACQRFELGELTKRVIIDILAAQTCSDRCPQRRQSQQSLSVGSCLVFPSKSTEICIFWKVTSGVQLVSAVDASVFPSGSQVTISSSPGLDTCLCSRRLRSTGNFGCIGKSVCDDMPA